MKSLLSLTAFCFLTISMLAQPGEAYLAAMQQGLTQLGAVETIEDYTAVANHFARIAEAEPAEWLPAYYVGYAYTMQSFMVKKDKEKDAVLDIAQEWLDKASAINPEESEILVLQAMLYQGRIQVDMMRRGAEFSMLQASVLAEAEELNPDNPRIFLMRGQNTYYTPAFFGGGKEAAQADLETAASKFETYEAPSEIWPSWGAERAAWFMEKYAEE